MFSAFFDADWRRWFREHLATFREHVASFSEDDDEYKPVWPSGLWATSQGTFCVVEGTCNEVTRYGYLTISTD